MLSVLITDMNEHWCERRDQSPHRVTLEVCAFEEIEIPLIGNGSRIQVLFDRCF